MKKLILLTIMLVALTQNSFGQNSNITKNKEKKLYTSISKTYDSYGKSPVKITYKVHPYGGSGNYSYRWKVKGDKFGGFKGDDNMILIFDCTKTKDVMSMVFCETKDLKTGKTHLSKFLHVVEICANQKVN